MDLGDVDQVVDLLLKDIVVIVPRPMAQARLVLDHFLGVYSASIRLIKKRISYLTPTL